jgi:UPF0755 protein
MIKRIVIIVFLGLIAISIYGIWSALNYRTTVRDQRQTAKAPQTSITIIPGWNDKQVGAYLQNKGIVSSQDFLSAANNFDISEYSDFLPAEAKGNLEGFLFPDTYFIPAGPQASTTISNIVIEKALDNFGQKVTDTMREQAASNGITFYQAMTLASIVEKEAGSDEDKATIAGIFYNRLRAGMPLQSDATVSYITGNADVSTTDTQINSPYNTFTNKGLPPAPICNPSLSSIQAALYPVSSNYLYFLTDPATGRAIYAVTYQEHLQNKAKYLK